MHKQTTDLFSYKQLSATMNSLYFSSTAFLVNFLFSCTTSILVAYVCKEMKMKQWQKSHHLVNWIWLLNYDIISLPKFITIKVAKFLMALHWFLNISCNPFKLNITFSLRLNTSREFSVPDSVIIVYTNFGKMMFLWPWSDH